MERKLDSKSPSPARNLVAVAQHSHHLDPASLDVKRSANPEVNEIIVKIEMKKFQNLIENRIKHKNNLLQADMKRVYPLTKKTEAAVTTGSISGQERAQVASPSRKKYRLKTNKKRVGSTETQGADKEATVYEQGATSGEDMVDQSIVIQASVAAANANANEVSQITANAAAKEATAKTRAQQVTSLDASTHHQGTAVGTASEGSADCDYEKFMPQSQLWFV